MPSGFSVAQVAAMAAIKREQVATGTVPQRAQRAPAICPPGYRVEVRTGRMCLFRAVHVATGSPVGTWALSRSAAIAQIAYGVLA
jgi:hypothetical protein